MHHRAKDITGLRVGFLTAMKYHGSDGKKSLWEMLCDCGKTVVQNASEMQKQKKRGITASCGCMRRSTIGQKNTSHGMSHHPGYSVWRAMLDRCGLSTHHAFYNYGARGITVCEKWQQGFDAFWQDMGPSYTRGLTLERLDNNAGYYPGNCAWRTRKQQSNNQRRNRVLDTPSGQMTLSQASEEFGIGKTTLTYRLDQGWPLLAALMTAPKAGNRKSTT